MQHSYKHKNKGFQKSVDVNNYSVFNFNHPFLKANSKDNHALTQNNINASNQQEYLKIFVGGLHHYTTVKDALDYFSQFGQILNIELPTYKKKA